MHNLCEDLTETTGTTNCCTELLERFEGEKFFYKSEILKFSGVDEYDVYNVSSPFQVNNKTVLAGRVEKRDVWADSTVKIFEKRGECWDPLNDAPTLKLEDPFTTYINNELVLGGVEVFTENNSFNSNGIGYRTIFYKGKCLSSLEKFAQGPDRMKDIRLAKSGSGRIHVVTRPQGQSFGKGQIGYLEINDIEEFTAEKISNAKIIDCLFHPNQWGGANELHLLEDGRIGVLGHIAYEDERGHKHYYAMTFIYNPETHKSSEIKILATRNMFPESEAKKPELQDVVFPGGLIRHQNGLATLYAGLSDARAGKVTLPDPFLLKYAYE